MFPVALAPWGWVTLKYRVVKFHAMGLAGLKTAMLTAVFTALEVIAERAVPLLMSAEPPPEAALNKPNCAVVREAVVPVLRTRSECILHRFMPADRSTVNELSATEFRLTPLTHPPM